MALLDAVPLTSAEAGYVKAAPASTLRGYRSDWREFTSWCTSHGGLEPLPAAPATVTGYLTGLAQAEAKVGTKPAAACRSASSTSCRISATPDATPA